MVCGPTSIRAIGYLTGFVVSALSSGWCGLGVRIIGATELVVEGLPLSNARAPHTKLAAARLRLQIWRHRRGFAYQRNRYAPIWCDGRIFWKSGSVSALPATFAILLDG